MQQLALPDSRLNAQFSHWQLYCMREGEILFHKIRNLSEKS
jgi:hypothetical protein